MSEEVADEICCGVFLWMLCDTVFHPYCYGCNFFTPIKDQHTCQYGIVSPKDSAFVSEDDYIASLLDCIDFDALKSDFQLRVPIAKLKHEALFSARVWTTRRKFGLIRKFVSSLHRRHVQSIDTYEDVMKYICTVLTSSSNSVGYSELIN